VLSISSEQEQEGAGAEGVSHPCPSYPGPDLILCLPFVSIFSNALFINTHIHLLSSYLFTFTLIVLEKPLPITLPFANFGATEPDTANPATTVVTTAVTTAVTTMVKRCASSMDSSTKWFFLLGRSLKQMQRVIRHQQMLPMILSSALFISNHSSWRMPAAHRLSTNKLMEKMLSASSVPSPRQLMTSSS
jgi:hypothetical protein